MYYVNEGSLKLSVIEPKNTRLSKKDLVFYNPAAKISRELTLAFLKSVKVKDFLDLLSASGAMGLRIAKELPIKVLLNDANPEAVKLIKKNINLNKIKNAEVVNKSANKLLKETKKFDYIDIDPFGPPVPFLDLAVQKVSKYLGVTSTDTSALSGTYPKACLRKYKSVPLKNEFMHETGIRILIKRVQDFGIKHNIALEPVFSFHFERYSRVFFKVTRNIEKIRQNLGYVCYCNECLWRKSSKIRKKSCPNCKGKLNYAGKLWIGTIWDNKIIDKMLEQGISYGVRKLLKKIKEEAKINTVGFYDLHTISKKYKKETVPKIEKVIENIKKKGFKASRTHFSPTGIRTNARINVLSAK
ncbi:MAG: tRNA (guanine(10)-N(2))-dimethyltransferase [Candidatus Woesearchaeota archaeon]|nr:MAG: tRNA (guanine(10)-N(2))-dimethyltransferase [Candidatus Woesearchaeota archaeon]